MANDDKKLILYLQFVCRPQPTSLIKVLALFNCSMRATSVGYWTYCVRLWRLVSRINTMVSCVLVTEHKLRDMAELKKNLRRI